MLIQKMEGNLIVGTMRIDEEYHSSVVVITREWISIERTKSGKQQFFQKIRNVRTETKVPDFNEKS